MKKKQMKFIVSLLTMVLCITALSWKPWHVKALSVSEDEVYNLLTGTYGFSSAQASGIMASIRAESDFIVNAEDRGGSFGLMQWTGNRKAALYSYASEHGMDVNTTSTQLAYMYYELQSSEKTAYNQLIGCDNTSDGAYNAGYRFCYYYERPKNKESRSTQRAVLARDTYFASYANGQNAAGTIEAPAPADQTTSEQTQSSAPVTNTKVTSKKKAKFRRGAYKLKMTMSVRAKASNKGRVVGYLSKGKRIYVKSVKNVKWGKITYRGKSSYVSLNYAKKL